MLVSAYIHIPFCEKRCNYCAFHSSVGKQRQHSSYCAALKKEIIRTTQSLPYESLFSVYIGGGTPSCINADELASILTTLTQHITLAPEAEVTVEANPHSLTKEWIEKMIAAGVNRISLGVQSLNNEELHILGRLHSASDAHDAVVLLRDTSLALSIDLMCGIPAQTSDSLAHSLNTVISKWQPEHVSVYTLSIELGTPFARWHSTKVRSITWPSDDDTMDMYWQAVDTLETAGYVHYEISNFCKPGCQSQHNKAYWNPQNHYIGFGAAAHSLCRLNSTEPAARRFRVIKDIPTYISRIEKNEDQRVFSRIRTEQDITAERIFLGLRRREGVKLTADDRTRFADIIAMHKEDKLLKEDRDGYISLTRRGIEVANTVMSDFAA